MMYQVLARANADAAWEPFQAMTRDPQHVFTLLIKARRAFEEVTVLHAETAAILREQVRRLRAGEPSGEEECPLPSLTSTPRISLAGPTAENQRWAIEQGPGGDHDVPYRFEATLPAQILARWAKLLGHADRHAGLPETLAELAASAHAIPGIGDEDERASLDEPSDEPSEAPAHWRSERIG